MKGWSIFSHSVSMLLRNYQAAMQIALVPTILLYGVTWLAVHFLSASESPSFPTGANVAFEGGALGVILKLAVILGPILVISVWSVVAWHRYILLEEMADSWIPRFRASNIFNYLLRLIQFTIVAVIVVLIGAFVGNGFVSATGVLGMAIVAVVAIGVCAFLSRLLLVLPAAAIGTPFGLNDALRATTGALPALALVSLCYLLLQFAVQYTLSVAAGFPGVGFLLQFGFTLVLSLLNASILTTLYGHYVEGRPV